MKKIIVDTDPGWDDALVLLLLLANPDLDVLCITTCWGNEDIEHTTTNASRMTYYLGRTDVPIYVGATEAMKRTPLDLPCPPSNVLATMPPFGTVVSGTYAPQAIVDMARKYGSDLTLFGIGTQTNIAAAYELDKAAMKTINLVHTGSSYKTHEFNLGADAVAVQTLLDADFNPVIITFDQEMRMNRGVQTQADMTEAGRKGNKYAGFYASVVADQLSQNNSEANKGVFDQMSALYALDPSIVTWEQKTIVFDFVKVPGMITDDPSGRRARMATIDVDRAYKTLYKRLGMAS